MACRRRGGGGRGRQLILRRWQALGDFLLSSGQPLALDFVTMLEKEGLVKPNAMASADWQAWREGHQVAQRLAALLKEAGQELQAVAPGFKKIGAVNYANTGAVYRPVEFDGLSVYVGFWPSRTPRAADRPRASDRLSAEHDAPDRGAEAGRAGGGRAGSVRVGRDERLERAARRPHRAGPGDAHERRLPTLVEVKRSSDTRIRREVVGQMLDYAANAVVYWPVERLRATFEANCRAQGLDPDDDVAALVGDDYEADEFWERVATNLHAGRVRLVFVADEIPSELQRVVEFLNTQMAPAEVLAIEVRQYVGEGLRTLVPKVLGQTAEAKQRKGQSTRERRQWDEDSFMRTLADERGSAEAAVAAA
jgi:hypothetical protein